MTQPHSNLNLPGVSDIQVPDWFSRYFEAVMSNPLLYIPKVFETWMTDRVAVAGLDIPIGQIVGFTGYTAQAAPTLGSTVSTNSTTYTSKSGPILSNLPAGQYVVLFGARASSDNGAEVLCAPRLNTAATSDGDACSTSSPDAAHIARGITGTLTEASNQIEVVYRSRDAGTTGSWDNRWMIVIKFANA